jgi:3-phosphoshikimate 1-carboxyvinyltransferase
MDQRQIVLKKDSEKIEGVVEISSSKSISNRVLIIQELCDEKFEIFNLSLADDTQLLEELISSKSIDLNCGAGGTTFRFLLALSVLKKKEVVLSGTPRLNERPIAPLLKSLTELGARFTYLNKPGFPPLKIIPSEIYGGIVEVDASVSSQFVSALMLIAPKINRGLQIKLQGNLISSSYVRMTAGIMKHFGVNPVFVKQQINITESNYKPVDITIPSDWSNAAYWYAMVACSKKSIIRIKNLANKKWQEDVILIEWMKDFGVNTTIEGSDLILENNNVITNEDFEIDLTDHPDLAQPICFMAAIKGIGITLSGLSTLRGKETDRLRALKTELEKTGVTVYINEDSISLKGKVNVSRINQTVFETYDDHRMAMSISILVATSATVTMNNPDVVSKSYPDFFKQLNAIGIQSEFPLLA